MGASVGERNAEKRVSQTEEGEERDREAEEEERE